jgi:hypothetical protein
LVACLIWLATSKAERTEVAQLATSVASTNATSVKAAATADAANATANASATATAELAKAMAGVKAEQAETRSTAQKAMEKAEEVAKQLATKADKAHSHSGRTAASTKKVQSTSAPVTPKTSAESVTSPGCMLTVNQDGVILKKDGTRLSLGTELARIANGDIATSSDAMVAGLRKQYPNWATDAQEHKLLCFAWRKETAAALVIVPGNLN